MATNRVVWTFFAKDKFSLVAQRIKDKTANLKKEFKRLHEASKNVAKSLKKVAKSLRVVSAVAAGAVLGSLKAFSDMEKGITNVLTLLDDKQVAKFGGTIDKLATDSLTKFGFNTEETTQALFNNVSALGANEKSFEAFAAAQKLAIGGVTTLDTSVSGIAAVMNAYRDEVGSAEDVANAFFAAQKKGTTDVTKLASNIGAVAPIAHAMGVSYQELLATMAQLTQGGLSTEEATTSLKGVLNTLMRPVGRAQAEFKRLGIPFGVTAVKGAGLAKTLQRIAEVAKDQPDIIAELIPNIRALTGVTSLGATELAIIQETIASMNQDQLSPAFEKQMATFSKSTALLKGNLVAMGITIGAQLAPMFIWLADKIRGLIDWFNGLSDTWKSVFSYALVVVAVLAGLFSAAAIAVTLFGAGAAIVAGAIGAAFAAIISVPGLIVAGIIAAGVAIWAFWDDIKGIAGKVMDFIGFGDDPMEVKGSADINKTSKYSGVLTVNTPPGTTADLKSKTTGDPIGLRLGKNMETAS